MTGRESIPGPGEYIEPGHDFSAVVAEPDPMFLQEL
jgi:hypothetical protein